MSRQPARVGKRRRPVASVRTRALLVVGGFAVSLGLAELALRGYHSWRGTFELAKWQIHHRDHGLYMKSSDPELRFCHRPNRASSHAYQHALTNAQGILRPQDVSLTAAKGTFRIGLVGDSLAASVHLPHEQRFATLLEASLAKDDRLQATDVEVLNFGVSGYSSTQEARLVETTVMTFGPDLLLVQYCLNDPGISKTPNRWFFDVPPPRIHLVEVVSRKLGISAHPFTMKFVPSRGPGHEDDDYWTPLYAPGSDSWKSVVRSFERIAAAATAGDVPVVLVVFPLFLDDSYPEGVSIPFHEQVGDLGLLHRWTVLDLSDTFAAYPVEDMSTRQPNGLPDIYHPSASASVIAARSIHESVMRVVLDGPAAVDASYRAKPNKGNGASPAPKARTGR